MITTITDYPSSTGYFKPAWDLGDQFGLVRLCIRAMLHPLSRMKVTMRELFEVHVVEAINKPIHILVCNNEVLSLNSVKIDVASGFNGWSLQLIDLLNYKHSGVANAMPIILKTPSPSPDHVPSMYLTMFCLRLDWLLFQQFSPLTRPSSCVNPETEEEI